jgi:hypothetical protein
MLKAANPIWYGRWVRKLLTWRLMKIQNRLDKKPIWSRHLDCVDADGADRSEQVDEDMELIDHPPTHLCTVLCKYGV